MKLHNVPGSPNGHKVEAVIHHLGLVVEVQLHNLFNGDLRQAEFLALNANAKVPVLVDGDFKLWESAAIMQYLAMTAGDESLFPRDARSRADIVRWQCWETTYYNSALGTLAFETIAKPRNGAGPPDARKVDDAREQLARYAPVLDQHLEGRTFLLGETLTLADYSLASLEPYPSLVPFDFSPFRNIDAYYKRMRQDASWKATTYQPRQNAAA